MNEPKHTPGPWDWKPTSGYDYGSTIYWVPGICHYVNSEADARLIAAAPDLLEALKALVANIDHSNWGIKSPAQYETVALIDARAAIAKAEGAQP